MGIQREGNSDVDHPGIDKSLARPQIPYPLIGGINTHSNSQLMFGSFPLPRPLSNCMNGLGKEGAVNVRISCVSVIDCQCPPRSARDGDEVPCG